MVTVELAMGSLAAVGMLIMMCWVIFVVVQQVRCIDTATEVARQVARGDDAAAQQARKDAPAGAKVTMVEKSDVIRVEVLLEVQPFGDALGSVGVRADAEAVWEPGEGG